MPKYFWKGIDEKGTQRSGVTQAINTERVKQDLLERNIALLSCVLHKKNILFRIIRFKQKIKTEDLILFFEHMSVLVSSGVDVAGALELFISQTSSEYFKDIVEQIASDVKKGQSIALAMQKFSGVFSFFMIELIRIAEHTGNLGFVFLYLAHYIKARQTLMRDIKHAATVPVLTFVFSLIIIIGIFLFVVPQFEAIFESMGKVLPKSTRIILSISEMLRTRASLFFVTVFFVFGLIFKKLGTRKKIRALKDRFLFKIAFFGRLYLLSDLINFLQGLLMFTKSGISLKPALGYSQGVISNTIFKSKVAFIETLVTQGKSLEYALRTAGSKYFPEKLVMMVAVGEQAGNLDEMLEKALALFQAELKAKLHFLTSILQPVLLIIVGVFIALIMFAVYLPIFNLARIL